MKSTQPKPETDQFNRNILKKIEEKREHLWKQMQKLEKECEGLELQSKCDHAWVSDWHDYYDGHRSDMEQYWYCQKECGAKTR